MDRRRFLGQGLALAGLSALAPFVPAGRAAAAAQERAGGRTELLLLGTQGGPNVNHHLLPGSNPPRGDLPDERYADDARKHFSGEIVVGRDQMRL